MIKLTLVFAILLVGCADLETFDAECGNFEIDPGEDCDEGAAGTTRCEQCRLLCDEVRTCHGFASYSCGANGYCSAPSGKLASTFSEVPTLAQSFAVTDVDGDLYGDLVSVSRTALTVNFGDATGGLEFSASALIPTLRGEPTFSDINSDATLDVVFPTADGVAAYSSRYQALTPHPFALDLGDPSKCGAGRQLEGQPFHVFRIDQGHLGVLVVRANKKLGVAVITIDNKSVCADQGTARQVCDITLGAMGGPTDEPDPLLFGYAEYDTPIVTPTQTVANKMIAVTSGVPNVGGACVINFRKNATTESFDSVRVFESKASDVDAITKPVILADLDGSGCPTLIDTLSNPFVPGRAYRATGSPGTCLLEATPVPVSLPIGSFAVGSVRVDPRAPPTPVLAPDAVVTTDGIFGIYADLSNHVPLHPSDRALTGAVSADIDADGDRDIIAISKGAEDIDVIQRVGDNFLLLRLDTAFAVDSFVVGDFDGNQIPDIAYTEQQEASQRLKVAYGTRDRPLEPIDVGAFAAVVGLVTTQTPDSTDPRNIIDDLVVLDFVAPPTPSMTLLHGSPQRTMQSYFDPRRGNSTARTEFAGVATGHFFPTPGLDSAVAPYVDMLAIDAARFGQGNVWPLLGTGYGEYSYTKQVATEPIGSCEVGATMSDQPTLSSFCTDSAKYTTWAREPDNDVVIGIDNATDGRQMMVIDLHDPGVGSGAPTADARFSAFPFAGPSIDRLDVRSMQTADLDGDGRRELIVAFAPNRPDPKAGTVLACSVNASGVPDACVDLVAQIPTLAGRGCVDASVAKITPAGPPKPPVELPSVDPPLPQDLVVVCHQEVELVEPLMETTNAPEKVTVSELYRVYHASGAYQAALLTSHFGSIETVRAGDVTGDGLDDIIGLRGRTLIVIPQCATNDEVCNADIVAQGEPAP